jgi:hypothetical protein
VSESQEIEGAIVPVLRLPGSLPWNERTALARKWLNTYNPEWISLQYVPFAFHPRGLAFDLADHLISISGPRPVHWMFHELWILWSFPLPLRQRLLGQAQKFGVRRCLKKVKPRAVATQLPIYQKELRKLGIAAEIHPLHGNIPVCTKGDAKQWLSRQCASLKAPGTTTAGFFGNILPTLDTGRLASQMAKLNVPKEKLVMLLAGKVGDESARHWKILEQELKTTAGFHQLGELNEREASLYFSSLDFGLTSYPPELMQKSGSVAAMREHGLPVIACGSSAKKSTNASKLNDLNGYADGSWTVKQSAELLVKQLQSAGS